MMDTKVVEIAEQIRRFDRARLSKSLMYEYYYEILKRHYGDAKRLVYMVTGKIVFYL